MKAAVLNPELPINSQKVNLNYFNMGHFSILIILQNSISTKRLKLKNKTISSYKNVGGIVNFDFPKSYKEYSDAAQILNSDLEEGRIISFLTQNQEVND
jgi:hypothetical protein